MGMTRLHGDRSCEPLPGTVPIQARAPIPHNTLHGISA
ncbi:hypothetical protein RC1_0506 [Rhodospirillum centenum SW]|uniref:Uncharacterized protein n=1 Tax=Rhodospirillum centenum (strain ATCC 51521 / SW) TaxID=414684 RepID=B6IR57_RHOCS|nr:hypothetical protein RC1_0506 [Rhodospirillum centenum SW]